MSEEFLSFSRKDEIDIIGDESYGEAVIQSSKLLDLQTTASWLSSLSTDFSLPPLVRMHNEIMDLNFLITPTPEELESRRNIVTEVESLVRKLWPTSRIEVFGSLKTSLMTPMSDIDITVLDAPSSIHALESLEILAETIKYSFIASYVEVIASAKFPIVKFDHKLSGISVDICINNSSGLDTGELMNTYLVQYPHLRPLVMVLKLFLSQRKLHDTYSGGIGSFALCNMVISFLQQRQRLHLSSKLDLSWNLACLLLDFLELYGKSFNYITTGISIVNDGYYFNKKDRGDEWFASSKPYTLSIENPDPAVIPPVDIGKNSFMIAKVRRAFEHAHQVMTSILNSSSVIYSYLAFIIRPDDPMLISRSFTMPTPTSNDFKDQLLKRKKRFQESAETDKTSKHLQKKMKR